MASLNGTESAEEQFEDAPFQTELTDEEYEILADLEGSELLGVAMWEVSLADDLVEEVIAQGDRLTVDLDLYLEEHNLLEIYGAVLYPSIEQSPLIGVQAIDQALSSLIERGSILAEVAETQFQTLALIFEADPDYQLIITAEAWVLDEWDELPEE